MGNRKIFTWNKKDRINYRLGRRYWPRFHDQEGWTIDCFIDMRRDFNHLIKRICRLHKHKIIR